VGVKSRAACPASQGITGTDFITFDCQFLDNLEADTCDSSYL